MPPSVQLKPDTSYIDICAVWHARGAPHIAVVANSIGHTKSSCFLISVISDTWALGPGVLLSLGRTSFRCRGGAIPGRIRPADSGSGVALGPLPSVALPPLNLDRVYPSKSISVNGAK